MRFRNFIFDLDGTLVDSLPGIEASIQHALDRCLPGRAMPSIREQVGPPIAVMLARIYPELQPAELDELVRAFREHYNAEGCRGSVLYPGVTETLHELHGRGASMFVLTNKPSVPTRMILDRAGILSLFLDVVSPDAVTPSFATKPAAAQHLAAQRALRSDETVVIGDGIDDAAAAACCSFAFVIAGYGYGSAASGKPAEAIAVIDSFREILCLPDKVRPL